MISAHDVVAYILRKRGKLTSMKLHKLLYYVQAWSLVRNEEPLFHEPIQAWVDGPVVPEVFRYHPRKLYLSHWKYGDPSSAQRDDEFRTLEDCVWSMYGSYSGDQLRRLTHKDIPWLECRRGLRPNEPSKRQIPTDLIWQSFDGIKYPVTGSAYAEGRITVWQACKLLRTSISDTVALYEEMNFSRSIDAIVLSDSAMEAKLAQIRRERLSRRGELRPSEDRAKESVIASQRIEGVDARPWLSN